MAEKIITAPMAKITLAGSNTVIGKIRNIRATENFRRGRVVGLGELNPSELPILEWSGTFNAGFYMIKLSSGIWNAVPRESSVADFVKTLLFDEGIQVTLEAITKVVNGTVVTYENKTIALIKNAVLTSEGMDVSEGQISGRDASFEYMSPILYT